MKQLIAPLLALLLSAPCLAQSNYGAQQVTINAQVNFGLQYWSNSSLMNYAESTGTTCLYHGTNTIAVPPNTTNYQVDLSALFPNIATPIMISMQDVSDPGQAVSWGLASGGQRFVMAANGFMLNRVNGGRPTLYIDNASS